MAAKKRKRIVAVLWRSGLPVSSCHRFMVVEKNRFTAVFFNH
jgi:hypothetical protein